MCRSLFVKPENFFLQKFDKWQNVYIVRTTNLWLRLQERLELNFDVVSASLWNFVHGQGMNIPFLEAYIPQLTLRA